MNAGAPSTGSNSTPPPWPRFRFRLRTLFILMALASVVLAAGPYRAREYDVRKTRAEKLVTSLGGQVEHAGWSYQPSPGANWIALTFGFGESPERFWKVSLAGAPLTSDHIRQLGQCGWIRGLDLSNTAIGDEAGELQHALPDCKVQRRHE